MESRYIRFEYNEAINAKKDLLVSQLELVKILKNIDNYKFLRSKEFSLKSKLNNVLIQLKTKLNLLESTLPKDSIKPIQKIKKIEENKKEERKDLEKEIEEIKQKLARLK